MILLIVVRGVWKAPKIKENNFNHRMDEQEESSFDEVCRLWMEVKHSFHILKKKKGISLHISISITVLFFWNKALKAGHMSVKYADLTLNRGILYIFLIDV